MVPLVRGAGLACASAGATRKMASEVGRYFMVRQWSKNARAGQILFYLDRKICRARMTVAIQGIDHDAVFPGTARGHEIYLGGAMDLAR